MYNITYVGVKTMVTVPQSGSQVNRLIVFMVITFEKWRMGSQKCH